MKSGDNAFPAGSGRSPSRKRIWGIKRRRTLVVDEKIDRETFLYRLTAYNSPQTVRLLDIHASG